MAIFYSYFLRRLVNIVKDSVFLLIITITYDWSFSIKWKFKKKLYATITFYNISILNIEKYLTNTIKIENVLTPVEK